MTPIEYCRNKAQKSGSSFLAGFKFLSVKQQDAMTALYAYCRELDDVVDECSDVQVARQTLAWWRQDLDAVYTQNGQPEHPVHQALKMYVAEFSFPKNELEELINGMEMDLHHVRYQTFEDLTYYCYRVAGVVGRLIARVLGFENKQTLEYAEKFGLALQLTNIIRDVGEDARMGRIYLPMDELRQFNCPASEILAAKSTPEFAQLMQFQINRAKQIYREARALLPQSDYKKQKAGLIMGAIYFALLREIELDGAENVLKYKIKIPNPRKMRIALWMWFFGFKP